MSSDEALMLDFQRGSREAFEEIFARYRQPLFGFFRRRLADKERAEDLAQETFLAVIRATARYEPRSLVRTYLYGIALNLLANERRRQLKDSRMQGKDSRRQGPDGQKQDGAPPDLEQIPEPSSTSEPETALWVRQALETLEARDREVLMLREFEQLSYTDIAQLLRMPLNTVRTRLFRARIALKEVLETGRESAGEGDTAGGQAPAGEKAAGKASVLEIKKSVAAVSGIARNTNPGPTESEA